VHLRHTGIESHSSLVSGGQIHSKLRNIFNKVSSENPRLSRQLRLSIAVKALNDTAGPDGLVPSLLVLGTLPRPPNSTKEFPAQSERFQAMDTARKEYERLIAAERVARGMQKQVTPAADRRYATGDRVYVYWERLRHWTGTHTVAFADGKEVQVHVGDRSGARAFNVSPIKPALSASPDDFPPSVSLAERLFRISFTEVLSPTDPRRSRLC
jgi:hypothetical protein